MYVTVSTRPPEPILGFDLAAFRNESAAYFAPISMTAYIWTLALVIILGERLPSFFTLILLVCYGVRPKLLCLLTGPECYGPSTIDCI